MLVEFPIAFFVATFVSDLIFWQTGNSFWVAASFWLLGAGLVMAALAAAAGLVDFLGEPKIRALNDAWWHAGGNVLAVLIQLCNWFLRYQSGEAAIVPTGRHLSQLVRSGAQASAWDDGFAIRNDPPSGRRCDASRYAWRDRPDGASAPARCRSARSCRRRP
jgi:hypothetical protein